MFKIISFSLLMIIAIAGNSQTNDIPDMSADRPGMATPPSLMMPKIFQIETGFSFEKITDQNISLENTLYNTSLLRFGLSKNAEIRLQTDYAQIKIDSLKITGFNPLTIGTKILITEGKGIVPNTSFMFNLTLPYLGERSFRPTNLSPSAYLLMQNDITEKLNVCYNLGLEYDGETPNPAEFAALCFGYGVSDKLSAFVENYDWFSNNSGPQNYLDVGCAYLTGKNFQVDVSGNMNLRDFKNYFMFNFGVSWRILKGEKKKRIGIIF